MARLGGIKVYQYFNAVAGALTIQLRELLTILPQSAVGWVPENPRKLNTAIQTTPQPIGLRWQPTNYSHRSAGRRSSTSSHWAGQGWK